MSRVQVICPFDGSPRFIEKRNSKKIAWIRTLCSSCRDDLRKKGVRYL